MDITKTALVIVDLQNDFLHPDGAYGRANQKSKAIAALPARVLPIANKLREKGGWVVSTQFTLVPGKDGEPFISLHLAKLRPFLTKGDFQPGAWGHQLVDELQPADLNIEKIASDPHGMGAEKGGDRYSYLRWHRHKRRRRINPSGGSCA